MSDGGFCIECGCEVKSFEGLKRCPTCESTAIPCPENMQVQISINWHELHVLFVWAENYARKIDKQNTIYLIAKRVQDQAWQNGWPPLTLAAELGEIAKEFEVETNDPKLTEDMNRHKFGEHG